jgi:hypothetical protein
MPDVKTNAIMPKGETNGLASIASELVAEGRGDSPPRLRAALVIFDCRRVSIDADSKEETATVRFRRVELLLPGDLPAAEKLIRRALESRSGQEVLELELEDDIRQAFDAVADEPPEGPEDDNPEGKGRRGRGSK